MHLSQTEHAIESATSHESATRYEPVLPVAEVVALEQRIAAEGTSLKELMARAGTALTQCILRWWEDTNINETLDNNADINSNTNSIVQPKAVIFTGSGNNGGDGWVVADLLSKQNWNVIIVCSKPAEELKAEPVRKTALEIIAGWNNLSTEEDSAKFSPAKMTHATKQTAISTAEETTARKTIQVAFTKMQTATILVSPSEDQLQKELAEAHVIVDGILGTGFSGSSIREPYASWIRLANQEKHSRKNTISHIGCTSNNDASNESNMPLLTIAADVPSGLSADTGSIASPCFRADTTVTMLAYKPGLILPESTQWTGELMLAPLI